MYELNVKSEERTLTLKWKDKNNLRQFLFWQRSSYFPKQDKSFEKCMDHLWNGIWQDLLRLKIYKISPQSKILDIGSGIGIINLLAFQYINGGNFFLLDKEEISYTGKYLDKEIGHGFYNSWVPTKDAIESTPLPKDKFTFLSPLDTWPKHVDLITSYGSYCWHYQLDSYWHKIKQSLRIGGKLQLEVSNNVAAVENVIGIVSEELKCDPEIWPIESGNRIWNGAHIKNGTIGNRCIWYRNK
jgi:SAM-dependent methyltransferase